MKKTLKRWGWLIILVMVLAVSGVIWAMIQKEKKKPHFDTLKVDQGTVISTVNTTGTVSAIISVSVGSQVSGKITKLYCDFNSYVKKGQLLAQVDPLVPKAQAEEANANLNSARATLTNYKAQYQNALSKVKEAEAAVSNSESQVEVARANLAGAINNQKSAKANVSKVLAQLANDKVEYERAAELIKKDFISHTEMDAAEAKYKVSLATVDVNRAAFDQATSGVKSAQMQLEAARHNLESAKIQVESQKALADAINAQVAQAEAQVVTAANKLKEAQINLSYTDIRSPIDGVVVTRAVDLGQTVAASFQTPQLFVIAKDLKEMEVWASVDEADIGKVREGMEATFTVDAYQEKFTGKIRQVRKSSTVDQGVVKYQVVISTHNPDLKLMPGMTANVTIISETRENCIRVPNGAIRFRPDSVTNFPYPKGYSDKGSKTKRQNPGDEIVRFDVVWVYEGKDMVRPEKIVGGVTDGRFTEMKKGSLKEGDELIVGTMSGKPSGTQSKPPGGGSPGGGGGRGGRLF